MVIQTNEHEFTGKTLQEYLEWKYPTREDKEGVRKISVYNIGDTRREAGIFEKVKNWKGEEVNKIKKLEVEELDLREFKNVEELDFRWDRFDSLSLSGCDNLKKLDCSGNGLTSLSLSGFGSLKELICWNNNLTSVDFLNGLSNPEKLEILEFYNNKIQPTDISFFSKFVNLRKLRIGTMYFNEECSRYYGSLKAYQNLTKLEEICIEATDVNEGLEYLPLSFAKSTAEKIKEYRIFGEHYIGIQCSPHYSNAKCKAIQNQLRPFNYDLEAWQLANPEKMLISRPELFTNPNSKEKWIEALNNKLSESHQLLIQTKEQEADKLSKITRLETKIHQLEQTKSTLAKQTQTEFQTQDKSTQTDLTGEQIKELEENKKTLYQKYVEKYDK